MSEQDNVAFLTGGDSQSSNKRSLYERNGVAVCSQKKALIIATSVFACLFAFSILIAFISQTDCPCLGQGDDEDDFDEFENSMPRQPKASNGEPYPWNSLRLPDFVRPLRYNITIHPNLTTFFVKGQVSIEFTVDKETEFLVLHSKNITITDKTLEESNGQLMNITEMLEFIPGQQLYIESLQPFMKNHNYTLKLRFIYRLSTELEGFYVSSYTTPEGEKRVLATTHFEATYARAAFPCFDEPHFKARFKLSIFRDRFHISLTNMPVANTEDAGFYMGTGLLRDDFEESVPMSTYLVAFVVCDYHKKSMVTQNQISVSVYAPQHQLNRAEFALETATTLMDFFENFFNVSYSLPKQDLIAIPDFAAGAMENWGLITYRESSILYDPLETSSAAHQWVAIVIAHELAHQWFGNLVTMRWWSDLWLNEGFASFLEYVGVAYVRPDWAMLEQFVVDKTQPALALDALASSHAISVEVRDPSEIEAIFDAISYSKGAAIIAMLEGFLGRDTLRAGLQLYLLTHEYQNADTTDLWKALSDSSPAALHVKSVMDTWTLQMGFPLVTIERNGSEVFARQDRFLMSPTNSTLNLPTSKFGYKWYIPLSYRTNRYEDGVKQVWMNMTDVSFTLPEDTLWFKANVNQSGFYRVNYDREMWSLLISAMINNSNGFSPADRASLIDDAFTLCRAGVLGPELPLEMSLYLKQELHYAPWVTALESMQNWARRLQESAAYKLFLQHMQGILNPAATRIGWNETGTHLQKLLRSEILSAAVMFGESTTVRQARRIFSDWMNNNKTISPNLREVVYTAGIKYGGEQEWEFCWSRYNTTNVPSERRLLLKALGLASDPWLLQRFLQASLDRNLIKPQDLKLVFAVVASNPEGRLLAWRHVRANWRKLQSSLGNSTAALGGLVGTVTSHFSSPYDVEEVSQFLRALPKRWGNHRIMRQSLENIQLNAKWVRSNERLIATWLKEHPI